MVKSGGGERGLVSVHVPASCASVKEPSACHGKGAEGSCAYYDGQAVVLAARDCHLELLHVTERTVLGALSHMCHDGVAPSGFAEHLLHELAVAADVVVGVLMG